MLLNARAWDLVDGVLDRAQEFGVEAHELDCGARVVDFGVNVRGSLQAGIRLAEVCASGLLNVRITRGEIAGVGWPHILVTTDNPLEACLYSQYAGWEIKLDNYYGMGSGPMRATAGREELFKTLGYREDFYCSVGVVESAQLPTSDVVRSIAAKARIEPRNLMLLVAPTSSIAGNLQVVARSAETALHKLFALGFDVKRVVGAVGTAPLSPVAADDLTGIGRSNDAILYGGRVTLMVTGDDDSIRNVGPKVPSGSSKMFGKPFLEIFQEHGNNFYELDPHLFSPAEIVFQNIETGTVQRYGQPEESVLTKSFGFTGH